jgi:hypothetical protein
VQTRLDVYRAVCAAGRKHTSRGVRVELVTSQTSLIKILVRPVDRGSIQPPPSHGAASVGQLVTG